MSCCYFRRNSGRTVGIFHFALRSLHRDQTPAPKTMINTHCIIVGLGWSDSADFEPHENTSALMEYIRREATIWAFPRQKIKVTLYVARGGPSNSCFQRNSIEYDLVKRHKLPSSVKAVMNDDNKLDPLQELGGPSLVFPDKLSSGSFDIHVLAELRLSSGKSEPTGLYSRGLLDIGSVCGPLSLCPSPNPLSYIALEVKKHL